MIAAAAERQPKGSRKAAEKRGPAGTFPVPVIHSKREGPTDSGTGGETLAREITPMAVLFLQAAAMPAQNCSSPLKK